MSAAAVAAPVAVHRTLPVEDAARGDLYALLARLLQGAPDAVLLAALGTAPSIPPGGNLAFAKAWQDLVDGSSVMDPEAAALEYEDLFVGVGKAKLSVYAGYYGGAAAVGHPRVRLQADLADLGLARREAVTEPEDHFAGLFEVMRVLVAGGAGRGPVPVAEQKRFFEAHVKAAATKFFAAVGSAPEANYYRRVAAVGAAFAALESESFQID